MTSDDEIPEHDPLAESARRALQRMADTSAVDVEPWSAVHGRGRRRKQLRIATSIAATVVVLAAGTAVVANAAGTNDHVSVAGRNETTTSAPTGDTSSSAPPTTPPTSPDTCTPGACVTVPVPVTTAPAPSAAPGPADFTGSIQANGDFVSSWSMALGDSVDIDATVTNVSDHSIEPSSSLLPASLATVCTSTASGAQSLWWMTSPPLAPGASGGRGGTFLPTDPYLGTVTCAVVIVTTDQRGTTFDTGAGGDDATASILAPVASIPPLVVTVQEAPPTTTTIAPPDSTTTTTTAA